MLQAQPEMGHGLKITWISNPNHLTGELFHERKLV